jgi:hypothetical protein
VTTPALAGKEGLKVTAVLYDGGEPARNQPRYAAERSDDMGCCPMLVGLQIGQHVVAITLTIRMCIWR